MPVTFRFFLPFPILALPNDRLETEGKSEWWVGSPLAAQTLAAKLVLSLRRHPNPPVMEALGWATRGSGMATYTGDSKGMFAITEVEVTVDALADVPSEDPVLVIYSLVSLVNSFIEQHTAATATLWTPRATPQDIIGVRYMTGVPGAGREGQFLSFGNMRPVSDALKPLMDGDPPPYRTLADAWHTLWGRTMLDAVREFIALRTVRASSLSALGFELFLNSVLSGATAIERKSLREKGEDLLGPMIGAGLNNKRVHGELANSWTLILAGRNALLHREEAQFTWTTVEGEKRVANVANLPEGGAFIAATARLIAYVQSRLPASG